MSMFDADVGDDECSSGKGKRMDGDSFDMTSRNMAW